MILLDTHIFLWLMLGDPSLSGDEQRFLEKQSSQGKIGLCAISVWEIAMLERSQRMTLHRPLKAWLDEALDSPGVFLCPLSPDVAYESSVLPGVFHKDAADRMIVATARILNAPLLTHDRRILDYAQQGFLDCVEV